jgi:hypothetical protein
MIFETADFKSHRGNHQTPIFIVFASNSKKRQCFPVAFGIVRFSPNGHKSGTKIGASNCTWSGTPPQNQSFCAYRGASPPRKNYTRSIRLAVFALQSLV